MESTTKRGCRFCRAPLSRSFADLGMSPLANAYVKPEQLAETRPDYVPILPWNLKHEITEQMAHIREWGGQFVVPIPEAAIL